MTTPHSSLSVCVFCGSRTGIDAHWAESASEIGQAIGQRGWSLVFGAGRTGLMGIVASAALQSGAAVTGVIPRYLTQTEPPLEGLTELLIVETMIERKIEMVARSDVFLVLPGGIGTFEELFEVWTATQTNAHQKPIVIANLAGYFNDLMDFVESAREKGFIYPGHLERVLVANDVAAVIHALTACSAPGHSPQSPTAGPGPSQG
ncbi:MAG: TIGR00730 family Rossman fold protein [Burkholderiaceae bacterium]